MDIKQCRAVLIKLLRGEVSDVTINTTPIINLISKRLCLDIEDVCLMLLKEPSILHVSPENLVENFHGLEAEFDIGMPEFSNLLFHRPNLIITKFEKIKFRVDLVRSIFDVSKKDALRLLYFFPTLFSLSKQDVVQQIEFLTKVFDKEDFEIRTLIRKEPRLMFANSVNVDSLREILVGAGFGRAEFTELIESCPELLFASVKDVKNILDRFCGKIYPKQDVKSIILKQPSFLLISEKDFDSRLKKIKAIFDISNKQAYELVREVPQILFYGFLEKHVSSLYELNINKNYILSHPKILVESQNGVYLKLMLAVVCNLYEDFEELSSQNIDKLLQKYLFLKTYNLIDYKLILLSDSDFEKRFNLQRGKLDFGFSITTGEMYKLIEQFAKNKNIALKSASLPCIETLIDFTTKDISDMNQNKMLHCEYISVLQNLGFTISESIYILDTNPNLCFLSPQHIQNIFMMLLKILSSREEVAKLVLKRPIILSYSTKDLENTLIKVATDRNIELFEALRYI